MDHKPPRTANKSQNRSPWVKDITKFLSAQTISLFGSSLVQFAIIWYITLETKSGLMMTLSTLSGFLPQIAISFIAGVWADRYNRKAIIMVADGAIAVTTLGLAILIALGYQSNWVIFIVLAVRSFGSGIQSPAVNAMIPQLVPKDNLMRVNGINGTLQSITFLISPAVAGALYGSFGLVATLFVDVTTAIFAILVMGTLRIKRQPVPGTLDGTVPEEGSIDKDGEKTTYWQDFLIGLRYVVSHKLIRSLFIFFALFMFLIVPAAILSPLYVARAFGDEVWKLTANEMLFSLGTAFGGLLVSLWGGFKRHTVTIALSAMAFGLLTVAMGLAPNLWTYLVVIFVTGIFIPYFNAASMVLFQENTPQDMLGRVFSFNQVISSASFPLGMLVFGPLADQMEISTLLIISGLVLTLVGISVFFVPSLAAKSES